MKLKIPRPAFTPISIAVNKRGGVSVEFRINEFTDEFTAKLAAPLHPDFQEAFDALAIHVARIYGLAKRVGTNKIKAEFDTKEVKVFKVAFSGTEDDPAVILSAKKEGFAGKMMALNTPLIVLTNESYGHEQELDEALDVLIQEAYEYVVDGKSSQLSIDDENQEEKESKEKSDKKSKDDEFEEPVHQDELAKENA